jgi:Carboxypeptidase regulatory-like domain
MNRRDHRVRHLFTGTFLILLALSFPSLGGARQQDGQQKEQQTQSQGPQETQSPPAGARATASASAQSPPGGQASEPQMPGSISGIIVDGSGAAVTGARVTLARKGQSPDLEVRTDDDGNFSFDSVAPGPFELTVTASGFATQKYTGVLHTGEICIVPQMTLAVASYVTEVQVVLPPAELAEVQIKEEEKQRVLGFIPNFYVSYVPDAVPLTAKQKFELAWKTSVDPVTFGLVGAIAGVQQALNSFSGYGQGAQGYGKRYGANYADTVAGTFIGGAILPSLLKQDPRYFYKGTGSVRFRMMYAIANAVICKGDNKRWQPNYSNILGSFAAGGISNLYYPAKDRSGAGLTFENGLIGIGATAAANLVQEFLVRRLTPNLPNHNPSKP